ncbi:hypothetical protein J15TS10_11960 [Paenibacillus woosongensis]|uniref:Uncharacterized protein n=1 Tax=Paenibacillus woosongensis TaxID=307580 RepID=A0ABQ4MN13_9BACL|nr:hypothetical protein J15TS10_11960 [Paenibacillus woosongensis]
MLPQPLFPLGMRWVWCVERFSPFGYVLLLALLGYLVNALHSSSAFGSPGAISRLPP